VVAALILALLGALVLYAGSRQPHLPPPFGLARDGIILASGDGDIMAVDPVTLERQTVIGGSTMDFGPTFSRDGTKFMFLRAAPNDCGKTDCGLMLMVANADGTGVRALTAGLPMLDWQDWSPDGRRIAIDAAAPTGSGHVLIVVNADGSGSKTFDVGRPVHELSWLPPTGEEIVFRGEQPDTQKDPPVGIFAVNVATGLVRELTTRPAHSDHDYQSVAVSPDGHLIAFNDDAQPAHQHILDLRTGKERLLPGDGEFGGFFSPDGTKIGFLRLKYDTFVRLVVASVDGSDPGVELGPIAGFGSDGPSINNYIWSPDGKAILANYELDRVARLVPIDGSKPLDLVTGDLALPGYQRLAP